MNNIFFRLLPAAVLCLPLLVVGQTGRADPAAAKASAPAALPVRLCRLQALAGRQPGRLARLNDARARAAGGSGACWTRYMPAMPAAASAPAPSASKPVMPHGAHHQHGGKQ